MEENSSWQVLLAKSNINILNVDDKRWYYEFAYHPHPGQVKWCKTFYELPELAAPETTAVEIRREVLKLRKELEK